MALAPLVLGCLRLLRSPPLWAHGRTVAAPNKRKPHGRHAQNVPVRVLHQDGLEAKGPVKIGLDIETSLPIRYLYPFF